MTIQYDMAFVTVLKIGNTPVFIDLLLKASILKIGEKVNVRQNLKDLGTIKPINRSVC